MLQETNFFRRKKKIEVTKFRFPCLIRHIMTKCDQLRIALIFTIFMHLLKMREQFNGCVGEEQKLMSTKKSSSLRVMSYHQPACNISTFNYY